MTSAFEKLCGPGKPLKAELADTKEFMGLLRPGIALRPIPYYDARSKDQETAMTTDATLTSKGQTTIPKEIRDTLGLQPGDRMTFTLMPDGTVVMRVKTKSVMDLAGLLRKKGRKPVPIERLSR
jgi:AbrB family looped-hinge helix DNA binding protein